MPSFTRSGKSSLLGRTGKKKEIQTTLELVEKMTKICLKLNQLFKGRDKGETKTLFHEAVSAFQIPTTKRQIHVYIKFNMQAVHP